MSNEQAGTESQHRKRTLLVVLIAIVVAAAIVTVVLVSNSSDKTPVASRSTPTTSGVQSPGPKTGLVTTFSGNGNETTKPFKVASNWEVRWRTGAGKAFAIELLRKTGASRGEIVTAKKVPNGTTFVSEAGDFKLSVAAAGSWSIQIFSRPTSK